jgi:hypothetical protein
MGNLMSDLIWLARIGHSLVSTDDDGQEVIDHMAPGECKAFKPIGIRDTVSHRRYWVLMTMTAKNVKRIEIDRIEKERVYMRIFSKKNAHNAMKLCTGLYEVCPVGTTDFALRVPHSTNFDEMSPEEWAKYWPQVREVLLDKVAPFIEIPEARDEMCQLLERWQEKTL